MGASELAKRSKSRTPEPVETKSTPPVQQDQAGAGQPTATDEVPPQGFGAAALSLSNPACKPGTEEFEAAKSNNDKLLKQYRERKDAHEANRQAKPDMKAVSEMADLVQKGVYGHIPGVAVGAEFAGRGELSVLSLHTQMMKGINYVKDYPHGAIAICMSGGYKDNDDTGHTFVYTGAGGQKAGKQVEDQKYDHSDNTALMQNYKTGTPVRVFRARPGKPPVYVYEGLYKVIGHTMASSDDGPKVIRFTMQGVPGHFVVSGKVEFKCLSRAKAFQKIQLAGADKQKPAERRKVPKDYPWDFIVPTKTAIIKSIREREKAKDSGRLVSKDISEGLERIPIPVWNALDDVDDIFVPTNLSGLPIDPQDVEFEYMTHYDFTDADDALELARLAEQDMRQRLNMTCGIQYLEGLCAYNEDKLLMQTEVCGVMECPEKCKGSGKGKNNLCKANRVVSDGIRYPLEVFKVPGKGWGARCAVDLPAGAVLCPYIGVVVTDRTAEDQKGADTYLYDLNHFHLLEEEEDKSGARDPNRNARMPLLPPELKEHHLVVDASHEGNVARFFNHSCDPNCLIQTVFARGARSHLLHYIVIVTCENVPKHTELTYDYGMFYIDQGQSGESAAGDGDASGTPGPGAKRRVRCNCGSYNCKGWLKD